MNIARAGLLFLAVICGCGKEADVVKPATKPKPAEPPAEVVQRETSTPDPPADKGDPEVIEPVPPENIPQQELTVPAFEKPVWTIPRTGHGGDIDAVAWSPDRAIVASGSDDRLIKLWNATTGELLHNLSGHTSRVSCLSFSPDGKSLASGSSDGTVRLWSVKKGESYEVFDSEDSLVLCVAFSPDGKLLAAGHYESPIVVHDISSPTHKSTTLQGHSKRVNGVAFMPESETLISCSGDGTILEWDLESGTLQRTIAKLKTGVDCIALSPDGKTVAAGSDDQVSTLETASGKIFGTLEGPSDTVESLAFSHDGKTLAVGSFDQSITLWSTKSGHPMATLKGDNIGDRVRSVCFSPDDRVLAAGSSNAPVRLWDLSTFKVANTLGDDGHRGRISALQFAKDDQTLVSAAEDNQIKFYDVKSTSLQASYARKGGRDVIRDLQVAEGGELFVTADGYSRSTSLWKTDPEEHKVFPNHRGPVFRIDLSADKTFVASGGDDYFIAVRNLLSDTEFRIDLENDYVKFLDFSPDGLTLASIGQTNKLLLHDVKSGKTLRTIDVVDNWVEYMSFVKNGMQLVTLNRDEKLRFWNPATGEQIQTIDGVTGYLFAFSSDGRLLATANKREMTIDIWDLDRKEKIQTLEGHPFETSALSFSLSGQLLASGDDCAGIKLWSIKAPPEIQDSSIVTPR